MPKKHNSTIWLAIAISIIGYLLIGFGIQRPDSVMLLTSYTLIFVCYLYLVNIKEDLTVNHIIAIGIMFRLLFLVTTPSLSDDFYRFIWDGRLWFNGINPFAELPTYYINNPTEAPFGINQELFQLLNSPTHYTIYPPIPQFINWMAAWLASDSIWLSTVILRIAQILAELGTLLLIPRLLKSYKINIKNVAWYALNPLIIIELIGNLHHEALMIFFMMLFVVNFRQGKIYGAGFSLAMAVAAKLLPFMFLPFILLKMNMKQNIRFLLVFGISLLIVFAPLLDASFFRGIEDSLLLYYQHFEFNAGIYYLFREVGYWVNDYNMIALIGKLFAIGTTILVLAISLIAYAKKRQFPETFLWISTVFALFSLILHPWYIALVILFSSITRYRFGILWSFLIMGTYAGYSISGFDEIFWIVALEFLAVLAYLIFELKQKPTKPN